MYPLSSEILLQILHFLNVNQLFKKLHFMVHYLSLKHQLNKTMLPDLNFYTRLYQNFQVWHPRFSPTSWMTRIVPYQLWCWWPLFKDIDYNLFTYLSSAKYIFTWNTYGLPKIKFGSILNIYFVSTLCKSLYYILSKIYYFIGHGNCHLQRRVFLF